MKKLITIPRIIGIALLVIAFLTYKNRGIVQSVLLALAGLVLILSNNEKSAKNWKMFVDSLKLKKEFAIIMLFDVLFWTVVAVLSLVLWGFLKSTAENLGLVQLTPQTTITAIAGYNEIIRGFFTEAAVALIVFWLLLVIAYSFSRGLIWLTLLGRNTKQFFKRFYLLNLGWYTIWVLIILFLMGTQKQAVGAVIFVVLLILYTHLTTILHYSYTKTPEAGKAVGDAFSIGFGRLGLFVQPYVYLFIVYIILYQIQRLAPQNNTLVITFLVFLAYMAWYRTYFRNILREIK